MVHTLRLDNYYPTPRKLVLGTNSSFGTESIKIERGAGWDGLNLTATWHIPGREEPLRVALLDGDAMDVPPEVTKEAKDGVLVLAGLASGVQRASCNVEYLILEQAGVYGGADAEPTPELAAQVLEAALQAKADAEAAKANADKAQADAEKAQQAAKNAAADAAKAGPYAEDALAAKEAAELARNEAIAAQQAAENAAAAAAASKSAADTLAAEAARAAQAAENSKAAANNAAKTAGDAASKVTNAGVDEKLAEMQAIQDDVTAKQAQTATDAVAAAEAKTAAEAAQADAAASKTAAESSASAAKESEKAAAKSAEEAKASTPASTLDGMYTAMLDGTNTQKIFKLWWPFAVTQSENKYSCLERFAAMLDTAWGDKTYTVRNIHESVSGDASGHPLDDLADGRSAAPLVTDASTGVADWAENDPMTWYVRANAKSLADGTMEVLAVETEAAFDVTGETAPVYCFSPALAVKEWDDGSYLYTSWHMRAGDGYVPMAGDVAPDGTHRLLTWHPAFYGGKNSAGGMTSGAGLLPMPWTSANAALPLARKLTAYDGLWCDCDTQFALMAWRLRHWTLSNSRQLEGCTNYNYQYTLAAAETGVKRVLLTKAQGANLLAGSCVCLGERGSNTNNDRNQAYNHDVFNIAKILSVETVTVNDTEYAAVNLELDSTIDTTTTMLVSTMPWPNGTTEALPGHSDGCIGNLTNGRYPYRIAGMEMQIGSYCEELDPLWKASLVDNDHWHYDVYSCRDSEKLAGSITANYQKVGEFDLPNANKWIWNFIRALNKMAAEAQIPTKFGGSSSTYVKAAFVSPGGAGVGAPWRFGGLNDGGNCGLPCAIGGRGPGYSNWNGVPRLAGSGKKRGEWPA